jgi:hypothetical protein
MTYPHHIDKPKVTARTRRARDAAIPSKKQQTEKEKKKRTIGVI